MSAPTAGPPGSFEVTEDASANRFLLHREGQLVGFADYTRQGEVVIVPHVETLAEHRGQGYGAILVDGLLDIIRADGHRIAPLCSFAAAYINESPHHRDLLA